MALQRHARLLVVLAAIALAAAVLMLTGRSRLPARDLYESDRQQLVQADLMYRLGQFWELWAGGEALPALGEARDLRERAMARYERAALGPHPDPMALHRLGVLYGERGYARQAREALTRAATLDEARAGLYFALADVYGPSGSAGRPLSAAVLPRLQQQEQWLADLAVHGYYVALGDESGAARALEMTRAHTRRFGRQALVLLSAYGGLCLIGLVIVAVFVVRRGFYVPPPPRVRPPLVVPWTLLDALEVVGVMFLGLVALGLLAGLLLRRLGDGGTIDLPRAAILALQYLAFTGVAVAAALRRVRAPRHRRLAVLGLRARTLPRLLAEGIGAYGVLVFVALATTFRPQQLAPLLQSGERLMVTVQTPSARIVLFVLLCVIAPLMEELIFRGFVYPALRRRLSVFSSVVASALLFALMHQSLQALAPIAVIGVALAVLYERNRSLVPCIICHALNNTLVFTLMSLGQ